VSSQVEELQDGKMSTEARRGLYTEQEPVEREQPINDGESVPVFNLGKSVVKIHP